MRTTAILLAGLAFWLAGIAGAAAFTCSCREQTFEDHFRYSALVFDGVAVSTRNDTPDMVAGPSGDTLPDGSADFPGFVATTFRVTRAIKGTGPETREIRHHLDHGTCGIGFKIGAAYRVYAYRAPQGVRTRLCTLTAPLDRSGRPRRVLDEDAPVPGKTLRDVIGQIRDPELSEYDAERLLLAFRRQEPAEREQHFIPAYIRRAETAEERAAEGRIGFYAGAVGAAEFYEHWEDYERAAEMYALAEKVAPRDAHFAAARGRALTLARRPEAAIPHLEQALRLDADQPDTTAFLARARLLGRGRLTAGVTDYRDLKAVTLTLDGANHPGIDLTGADIFELSARGARLPGANLGRVLIKKGNFRNANLAGALVVGSIMRKIDFTGASLKNAYAVDSGFSGSRFTGADLRGMHALRTFFHGADLRDARLEKALFTGADFRGARFEGVLLAGADFTRADMTEALLQGADLRGAVLTGANFLGARIDCGTRLPEGLSVKEAGMIPVAGECGGKAQLRDFSGRNWQDTDFSGLDLGGASFAGVTFVGGDFAGVKLQNTDFSGSSGSARFLGADLSGADFTGSTIEGRFYGVAEAEPYEETGGPAVLSGTDFTGARLKTSALLGDLSSSGITEADYTTARFDRAHMSCMFGSSAETADERPLVSLEPEDPVDWVGEKKWAEISEAERRFLRHIAESQNIEKVKTSRRHTALIRAERRLVAFLRRKWTSATFGENCRYYLEPADAAPAN